MLINGNELKKYSDSVAGISVEDVSNSADNSSRAKDWYEKNVKSKQISYSIIDNETGEDFVL